ncbi:MAG: DUF4864 domain-containing protein [Rhodospirillales bacterium]
MDGREAMRFLGLVLLALIVATGSGQAQDARASSIQAVIDSQLEAFQRDDGARAFSFASPTIQQQFGTPTRFMTMVQQGYDPVYRPTSRAFREPRFEGDRAVQEVVFLDRDNRAWLATYFMEQQADGSWRIAGVRLEAQPEVGA